MGEADFGGTFAFTGGLTFGTAEQLQKAIIFDFAIGQLNGAESSGDAIKLWWTACRHTDGI
jgi:hypothetical protein